MENKILPYIKPLPRQIPLPMWGAAAYLYWQPRFLLRGWKRQPVAAVPD